MANTHCMVHGSPLKPIWKAPHQVGDVIFVFFLFFSRFCLFFFLNQSITPGISLIQLNGPQNLIMVKVMGLELVFFVGRYWDIGKVG